jgi:hypothetical protein
VFLAAAQLVAGGKPAAAGQTAYDPPHARRRRSFDIASLDPARAFEETS